MIGLDLDLSYLSRYYNISSSALEQYQNMSIVQMMQTEAEKGNKSAADFLMKITSDPKELANVFQLVDPKNRFLILAHMNQEDLANIMQYLQPEELILGLSIFNQDMLVQMLQLLDPESLATVVLNKMDSDKFLKLIPEDYLNDFLMSENINKNMMMKALEEVDEDQLQKMMENFSGESCYDSKENIIQQMGKMEEDTFKKIVLTAEPEGKQQLISGLLQKKPELFEEFSAEAMAYPFKTMQKEEILKSLTVLDTKEMLPMVEDMPQEIMALIATQIDPAIFSKILCSDFKEVIASCGIA